MRFDLITIFPEFFAGPLDHGIVRRAREAGLIQLHVQDLREFTKDRDTRRSGRSVVAEVGAATVERGVKS